MHIKSALLIQCQTSTTTIQAKFWLRSIKAICTVASAFQAKAVDRIRIMLNLLSQKPVVRLHNFKCLAKHRIEWFPLPRLDAVELRNHACERQRHPSDGIITVCCLEVQRIGFAHGFTCSLDSSSRLIHFHWHAYFGKILADETFDQFPNWHRLISFQKWQLCPAVFVKVYFGTFKCFLGLT